MMRLINIALFGLPWVAVAILRNISKTRKRFLRVIIGLPILLLALVTIGGMLFYGRFLMISFPPGFLHFSFFGFLVLLLVGFVLETRPIQKTLAALERWLYRCMVELPPDSEPSEVPPAPVEEGVPTIAIASIATKGVSAGVSVQEAVKHLPPEMRDLILRECE